MLNISVWVFQFVLAAAFIAHGWLFLSPPANMVAQMNAAIHPALRIFIGVAEVLAAVGLTLPGVTRIMPSLVPAAAAGLVIVMISATFFHLTRGEMSSALVTVILLALVSFVAYIRWRVLPILPRAIA
jgi:uncharacterized membrane protein YphA (DoxX/SURF4 family)